MTRTKQTARVKGKKAAAPATPALSTSTPKDYLKNSHPYAVDHLRNAYITQLSHENPTPMPLTSKKRKSAAEEDVDDVPSKRGKGAAGNTFQPSARPQVDTDGNKYWEISKARRVTISEYKGTKMVGIREYYEKDGQSLPGKKGISMNIEQYAAFIQIMPQVEELLKSQGASVPRPNYSGSVATQDDDDDEDLEDEEETHAKQNIEATSDEEEDE